MMIDFPEPRMRFSAVDGGGKEGAILYISFYTHSIDLAIKHTDEQGRYLVPLTCVYDVMPQVVNNWLIRKKNDLRSLLETFTFRNNGDEHVLCKGAVSEYEDSDVAQEFRKKSKELQRSFYRLGSIPENLWLDIPAKEFLKASDFVFEDGTIRHKVVPKAFPESNIVQLVKQVDKKAAQTGVYLLGTYDFVTSLLDPEI